MTSSTTPRSPAGESAFLSLGFRPFFLAAALFGAIAILLWMPLMEGQIVLPTALAPLQWHAHELLFGYLSAVFAGFLLTAIPNWTGCEPLRGRALGWLALLWVAGRVGMSVSAWTGPLPAALVDLAFLPVVLAWGARRIFATGKRRNLVVVALVGAFIAGDALFLLGAASGDTGLGLRLGLAAAIGAVILIGGRIIPAFTRNWLARRGQGRLPAPFSRPEAALVALSGLALAAWVVAPGAKLTGTLLLAGGLAQAARLARWAGERTASEILLLILHLGYACVPLGFLLTGAAALWPGMVPVAAGIHAWTVGAVGLMTLAVMTRASLGHTGRRLSAGPATVLTYSLAGAALATRLCAAFAANPLPFLHAAGGLLGAAFLVFAAAYFRPLTTPGLSAAE